MDPKQTRRNLELVFPGFAIGMLSGCVAGAVALGGGLPGGYAVAMALSLGLSLGLFGVGYNVLLAQGKVRLGGVAPAALFWLFAFPISRLINEVAVDLYAGKGLGFQDGGIGPFLLYQAMLSLGFTVGFIWMHEYVFSYWWIWIRGHNPVADHYILQYQSQAVRTNGSKQPSEKSRKLKLQHPAVRAHAGPRSSA